jgi:hypothetical protein
MNWPEERPAGAVAETVPAVHGSAYCPAHVALAMLGRLVVGRRRSPEPAPPVRIPARGQGWLARETHASLVEMTA